MGERMKEFIENLMRTGRLEGDNTQRDDLAHLREALKQQPTLAPPEAVRGRVMAAVAAAVAAGPQRYTGRGWGPAARWAAGFGMAVVVFVLLWAVVRPGVVLGWTVSGEPPAAYRVYRSLGPDEKQALVREVKALPEEDSYRIVDPFVLPAARYTYTVEGVASNGRTIASQSAAVDAATVLPAQVAILVASLLVGWGAVAVFNGVGTPTLVKKAY